MYSNTTIRVRRSSSYAIDTPRPRLPNADTMAAMAAMAITTKIWRFDGWTKRYIGEIALHINNSNPPSKKPAT